MKTIKTTIAILALSIFSFSCSKDDAPASQTPVVAASEQNPIPGFLIETRFNQRVDARPNATTLTFIYGFSFIPLVDGKITAIVAKLPGANPDLKVTIWDKATGASPIIETINLATANLEVTKSITPLNLVKNKEYVITFSSNDSYKHYRTNETNVTYPITSGDIQITGIGVGTTFENLFDNNIRGAYFGDISFKFQK